MGKRKHRHVRRGASAGGVRHPLLDQAQPTPEMMSKARLEVTRAPNPYGEVVVNGEPIQHSVVRRQPAYVTMARQGVIDLTTRAVLDWYAARHALAEAGAIKCGLGDSGGRGATGSHIPLSEAQFMARRDLDWLRAHIPADCLAAFDMVMIEDLTFAESARREAAGRHVRAPVSRTRERLSAQFKRAARAVRDGYFRRWGSTVRGIVVSRGTDA